MATEAAALASFFPSTTTRVSPLGAFESRAEKLARTLDVSQFISLAGEDDISLLRRAPKRHPSAFFCLFFAVFPLLCV
jgi:hypothetical protein